MTTTTNVPHPVNRGTVLANAQQAHQQENRKADVIQSLRDAVQADRLVGDLSSMDYDTAEVLIHDAMKMEVGGVPHGACSLPPA